MRLKHFHAFAPRCPVCARAGRAPPPLVIAAVAAGDDMTDQAGAIQAGMLHCPDCLHEYPIVDGMPIIVPDLRRLLGERGLELLLRDDLDAATESLFGDAIGPDSWLDAIRQTQSTYMWDAFGDLDPDELFHAAAPVPGAARRCLARLLELAGAPDAPPEDTPSEPAGPGRKILDLGCGAGRTSFDLATAHPGALVLGLDIHLGLLRLAAAAAAGNVSYPRRRIGLVFDRRRFPVSIPDAERVAFWACDALALPFAPAAADLCVALNLLDCVPDPRRLLEGIFGATAPGGRILLATPYDWSTRATPLEAWLGGHSQRAAHAGAGEVFLRALLSGPAPGAVPGVSWPGVSWPGVSWPGVSWLGEEAAWPWQTRLHDRAAVAYRTHLVALRRDAPD